MDGRFQCRELGYCSWLGDSGRVAFKPFKPFRSLTDKEKFGVSYVKRHIHGMTYNPDPRESRLHTPSARGVPVGNWLGLGSAWVSGQVRYIGYITNNYPR